MKRSLISALFLHASLLCFGQFKKNTIPTLGLNRPERTIDTTIFRVKQNIVDRFDIDSLRYTGRVNLYNSSFMDTVTARFIDFDENVAFSSSSFEKPIGIDYTHFNASATFLKTRFFDYTLFDSIQFRGQAYFFDAVFFSQLDIKKSIFHKGVTFERAEFSETTTFSDIEFRGKVNFTGALLPDTLYFKNITSKEIVDLTVALLDTTRKAEELYCYIDLMESDLERVKFRYDNFRFIVPEDISKLEYDRLYRLFQKQLETREVKGSESYELLDKDFKKLKLTNNPYDSRTEKAFNKFAYHCQGIWNDHGYEKWYILFYLPLLMIFFTFINYLGLSYFLKKVYPVKNIKKELSTVERYRASTSKVDKYLKSTYYAWGLAFYYTAHIFLGLKLELGKLDFKKLWSSLYILIQYVVGVYCLASVANYIIS